jgi:hypothetical protein
MVTCDPKFRNELAAVLEENDITPGLLDILDELPSRPAFYSMPVYTRYSQLAFMAGLGFAETNRQLIRASTGFLERELDRRHAAGDDRARDYLLCMVTIPGWDLEPDSEQENTGGCNDGTLDYLTPHIFVGDLRREQLAALDVRQTGHAPAFQPPASQCADFTAAALDHSTEYVISQNPAPAGWPASRHQWWPERVYIRITGYPRHSGKAP